MPDVCNLKEEAFGFSVCLGKKKKYEGWDWGDEEREKERRKLVKLQNLGAIICKKLRSMFS